MDRGGGDPVEYEPLRKATANFGIACKMPTRGLQRRQRPVNARSPDSAGLLPLPLGLASCQRVRGSGGSRQQTATAVRGLAHGSAQNAGSTSRKSAKCEFFQSQPSGIADVSAESAAPGEPSAAQRERPGFLTAGPSQTAELENATVLDACISEEAGSCRQHSRSCQMVRGLLHCPDVAGSARYPQLRPIDNN